MPLLRTRSWNGRLMNDTIETYIKNIRKYPLLSREEEIRLSNVLNSNCGDKEREEAENTLILSNLRLVVKQAMRYSKPCPYMSGITVMDLIGSGNIALITMVRKKCFNSKKGKFSTFIHAYIKRAMLNTLINHGNIIRYPPRYFFARQRIHNVKIEHENITDNEIIHQLKISPYLLKASEESDQIHVAGGCSTEILAQLEDDGHVDVVESMVEAETANYIRRKIKQLTPAEKLVLNKWLYEEKELKDIAKTFSTSRQAAYETFNKALNKLKKSITKDIKKGVFDPGKLVIKNVKIPLDSLRPL